MPERSSVFKTACAAVTVVIALPFLPLIILGAVTLSPVAVGYLLVRAFPRSSLEGEKQRRLSYRDSAGLGGDEVTFRTPRTSPARSEGGADGAGDTPGASDTEVFHEAQTQEAGTPRDTGEVGTQPQEPAETSAEEAEQEIVVKEILEPGRPLEPALKEDVVLLAEATGVVDPREAAIAEGERLERMLDQMYEKVDIEPKAGSGSPANKRISRKVKELKECII